MRNRLIKCARLFRYFCWFLRRYFLKFDDRKYFDCCHALGHHERNISNFTDLTHINFHENPTNLHTLSIHWSRDKANKSIPQVFGHLRNSQFSHLSPRQCSKDADQRNATSNPPVCFVDLQWIKRSPKIHPQKRKEKVGKRSWGKKKTLTSISSAHALSRLFSFWLFNKESYFLTFFDMWRKFPFLVWCKMRCEQHMQSESRTKAHEKRQHFAGGLSLFSIGFPKTFFRPYLAFF